ncbi:ImmA/IrrE family metallo-endopeptidase [Actinoalloteichus sp. AHMU CJ021]|uniref:Formylmethanofuran dehydrogenase, subunit B n=1 Tax=Actinoalloteichus caeruleus DSM 43889 TaxID=1120930 RepID=A0ABT1JPX7_ACTCY|nr:ImmA/IrrE family metallo-endopeptidase [Actinoalloteichus caeruleus]AUS80042.1 ImmA/IrrE family metallo-endopeptidase [Actinoalloteichus sp. AHMU CJ021]MCP2334229.1 formylmethanofuran dehydrogenase, subunit B [Actinoalloteichus caeruleus DSM 43889]
MRGQPNLALARRRAKAVLATLDIPVPWSLTAFLSSIERQRGRRILLVPSTMSRYAAVASGLWISRGEEDLIVYDATASPLHRQNTVFHELAHMLLGHRGRPLSGGTQGNQPPLMMHRQHYEDQLELEAETLAYEMWRAVGQRLLTRHGTAGRLAGAFEAPPGVRHA